MTRSNKEQVKAAMDTLVCLDNPSTVEKTWHGHEQVKLAMEKLLAGKFAEAPLPEIQHPGKAWDIPYVTPGQITGFRVYARSCVEDTDGFSWDSLWGPYRATLREAILAWNAGLSRDPQSHREG